MKIINYPDGQMSVDFEKEIQDFLLIKERINSYADIFKILAIVDAARTFTEPRISLFIPCMFGQRSDRRFARHQSFDLKTICNVFNTCNFDSVSVFDPHSDVTLALLNNSYKLGAIDYVHQACKEELPDILISPDAGAYKKVFEHGADLGLEVGAAVKHRATNGDIDIKFIGDVSGKRCLIVDDLIDGGYTFIKLADQLRNQGASRVSLYVSHGYFSKGFEPLFPILDRIYCTNSVKDVQHDFVTQYKIV